jgi:hypothetical protein
MEPHRDLAVMVNSNWRMIASVGEVDVAHILASLMFATVAIGMIALISVMLLQAEVAIARALGMASPERVRDTRLPVRVRVRRTTAWSVPRQTESRHAA